MIHKIKKSFNELTDTSIFMIKGGLISSLCLIIGGIILTIIETTSPYYSYTLLDTAKSIMAIAISISTITIVGGLIFDYYYKNYVKNDD